jgi:hypothetical protein
MWNATGIKENAAISLEGRLILSWMLKEMDKLALIILAKDQWQNLMKATINFRFPSNEGHILTSQNTTSSARRTRFHVISYVLKH